jgi:hypothetical protein
MVNYDKTVKNLVEEDINVDLFHTFAGLALQLKKRDGSSYATSVLGEYFRKAKEEIRKRFPTHAFWATLMTEGEGEGLTGDGFCLSLATSLSKELGRAGIADAQDEASPPVYRSMLIFCIANILSIQGPTCFMMAFLILITYSAMGRGGEAKLLSWHSTGLDLVMQLCESRWFEEKTIRGYPMSFFSDVIAEMDFFFLLSGFLMSNGLFRTAGMGAIQVYRIFPKRSDYATYISKLLKKYSGEPKATSRSLRKATSTVTYASRSLLEKDTNARGGWLAEGNAKHYIQPGVAATIPAGVFLAGHPHVPEKVFLPVLPNDLTAEEWENVMDECYKPISIPEFKEGGRLRPLLRVCLASTLRFYSKVFREYSPKGDLNAVMVMINKLKLAIEKQPTVIASRTPTHVFLLKMSKEVATNWLTKNLPESKNQALQDLVSTQAQRLGEVMEQLRQSREVQETQGDLILGLSASIDNLARVVVASRSKSPSKSPSRSPSPSKGPQKRKLDVAQLDDDDDEDDDDDDDDDLGGSGLGGSGLGGSSSKGSVMNLSFNSGDKIAGKGITIAALLNGIADIKGMGSILTDTFNYQEKPKVKLTLIYVNDVITADEMKDLKEQTKNATKLMQICQNVEDRCMIKMDAAEVEEGIYVPKAGVVRKLKTFFLGFAQRIIQLNKKKKELEEDDA